MGEVINFIPRPNHNRETDFPAIPFKTSLPALAEQAKDILTQIEGTHANAIWGQDKEPA